MSGQGDEYSGPIFSIVVTKSSEGGSDQYQWKLEMSADDYKNEKKLGYTATGMISLSNDISGKFDIKVYELDGWKRLLPDERKPLRNRIESAVATARRIIKGNGY